MTDLHKKYPLKLNRYTNNKKKFAIGLLVYPGIKDPKWNYLFGACMISYRLKKNDWFKNNCDITILTPNIDDPLILSLIKNNFDVHAIYSKSLNTEFPFKTNPRWYGVFNKLYFWNKNFFNYERLLILDTDLFILKSNDYVDIFSHAEGPVAGCYENGFIVNNTDLDLTEMNVIIPDKYTCYVWNDKRSYYNMVNAGVLSLQPNVQLFNIMLKDLEEGWHKLSSKYPSLKNKRNNFLFPEQEYLTGFFSGQWRSLPRKYLSCITSSCHYNNHGAKYWDKFPSSYGLYGLVVAESHKFLNHFPECSQVFGNIIQKIKLSGNIIEPNIINNDIKDIIENQLKNASGIGLPKKTVTKKNIVEITHSITQQKVNSVKKNDISNKIKNDEDKEFIGVTNFGLQNELINAAQPKKNISQPIMVPKFFKNKSVKEDNNDNLDNPDDILFKLNTMSSNKKNFIKVFGKTIN